MQIFLIITTFIFLFSGIIFSYTNRLLSNRESRESVGQESKTVKGTEDENSILTTATPTSEIIEKLDENQELLDYRYPDSQIIKHTESPLLLNSVDDIDVITNWYKEKIIGDEMNVKTFVNTKANDKILNKLVGVDGSKQITIEVSKESADSVVVISVNVNDN